jgi:hypothetical protein
MMARYITAIALAGGGIVLGAAATEGFNVYRRDHDSRIFQERVHCKAVADAYVKANSTDSQSSADDSTFVSVTLDRVDYSPARNSCVAELETAYVARRVNITVESVQDLLSGETLFSSKCADDCEALKNWYVDGAFDYTIKNASAPVELEKALALSRSKVPSKPTTPPKIDPQTGEEINPGPK